MKLTRGNRRLFEKNLRRNGSWSGGNYASKFVVVVITLTFSCCTAGLVRVGNTVYST